MDKKRQPQSPAPTPTARAAGAVVIKDILPSINCENNLWVVQWRTTTGVFQKKMFLDGVDANSFYSRLIADRNRSCRKDLDNPAILSHEGDLREVASPVVKAMEEVVEEYTEGSMFKDGFTHRVRVYLDGTTLRYDKNTSTWEVWNKKVITAFDPTKRRSSMIKVTKF